jgi:cytochrome c
MNPTAALAWLLCLLALAASGCVSATERAAEALTGGSVARGHQALRDYGCVTCHTIPGVYGADALVGPPLNRMGARVYVAGELPNTPENLMRWIRDPRAISPRTAMPDTGVTEADARHIVAYLYTLD